MLRSPVEICGNETTGRTIHSVSGTARLVHESRTTPFARRNAASRYPSGLRSRLTDWAVVSIRYSHGLDNNCGSDGWTLTPSSTLVVNDALAVYFADVTTASAFVARWCAAQRPEMVDGAYRVRDDEPTPRKGAGLHKTP
jgi:hypothetical protein